MKRFLTASVIAGLLAAGCTSGDTASDTTGTSAGAATTAAAASTEAPADTTAATEPAATDAPGDTTAATEPAATEPTTTEVAGPPEGLDGPAPGVTDDTIKIGVTYIDLGSTNVATSHGDYQASYHAVIDQINTNGGINGRMLEPVFAPISLADGGNADAVCVQLTEDDPVFVVVGFFLGDAPACYLETHQTAIIGGTQTPDLLARAQAPWYTWEVGSDFITDSLIQLAAAGDLDGKVGVYAASADEQTVNDIVLPTLEANGITVAEVGINDAPNDDQVLTDAQNAAILQKFQDAGVEIILAPGNGASGALGMLETSSYRVPVVSTNLGVALTFAQDPDRDKSVLEGFVGTGAYGPVPAQLAEPDAVKCGDLMTAAGIDYYTIEAWSEGMAKPWVSAIAACTSLTIFQAIATKAGQNLNYGTYQWAGDNLGELKLPGSPDPYFFGAPPHADGDTPVYVFQWDPDSQSMVLAS